MPMLPNKHPHNTLGNFDSIENESQYAIQLIVKNLDILKTICNFITKDGDIRDLDDYFAKHILPIFLDLKNQITCFFVDEDHQLCYQLDKNNHIVVGTNIKLSVNDTKFIRKLKKEKIWIMEQAVMSSAMGIPFSSEMVEYVNLVNEKLSHKSYTVVALLRPEIIFYGKKY